MSMDFTNAPTQNDFSELVPHGTLAKGLLRIKWFNRDQGLVETQSKSSDARYLDCEITIVEGDFKGRKIFTRIGTAGSEGYCNMGRAAIRAILECSRNAHPQNNPQGYLVDGYQQLDNDGEGAYVAFKVKEEPEQNGYPAKNDIAVFLSPVPESGTKKDWDRLMAGDTKPSANTKAPRASGGGGGAPAASAQPAWATGDTAQANAQPSTTTQPMQQGAQATPTAPAAAPGKPAWLNSGPTGDDEIPF